tara:strand:+ start:910 stop:1860 length:951 start_codon:yes stop_codon:yes gene_type:complete
MNSFGIILGEPNSINSEILAKSSAYKSKAIVIGSYHLLKSQLKILKIKRKIKKIENLDDIKKSKKVINILDIPLKFKKAFSVNSKESSNYVKKCLMIGHNLCLEKKIKGMINCSVSKKNLFKNKNQGVTEFLARKNKVYKSEVMLIYNKKLSVVPLTTHIKIKDVSKSLKKDIIVSKLKTLDKNYRKYFKKKPKIAILGLNPHNFEFKKNSEEVKLIKPIVNNLSNKINISGPYSADTIFFYDNLKKYDVIVGMYHDQVLTPFKALFGFDAINITLGLPYIRMSPDHGVAEDKKKLNKANPQSLNSCIKIISKLIK